MRNNFFLFLFLIGFFAKAQIIYDDFGFTKIINIPVIDSIDVTLANAWGGGLNSCQYGAIDLNLDGINDLIVFDRNGNRLLTFLNNGTPNSINFSYAPAYSSKFPYIHDWIQLHDFNCDGKTDIFTYNNGGIAVFENISNLTDGLKFKIASPLLNSLQGTVYTNILVTSVDYPAISDIDNDGDLDILTFFGLGSFVEFHKNLSKELFGNCDSLKYILSEYCWGKFSENEGSNKLTLNVTCPYKLENITDNHLERNDPKHTGSTLLAIDLDSDSDKDLILGDVDFPNLIALTNGGDFNNALMISQDTLFPSNTSPINLFSFPVAAYIDINNDNKKDLLVSPFDGNILIDENKYSNWLYTNSGTNNSPIFNYQMPDFIQKEMIDVGTCAYPLLFDYDGDGLDDLIVGNYGYRDTSYYSFGFLITKYKSQIAFFKNIGSSNSPQFKFINDDVAHISNLDLLNVYPAFADIDNDGKAEMIIGNKDGTLILFKNIANIGNTPNYILQQTNYQNIDVGDYSTPQLFDLNQDGLFDLVIGEKGLRKGNLNYYQNTGTLNNPIFTFITDSLGGVDVCDHNTSNFGYSIPSFFMDDSEIKLFVGSEQGYIHYYKNINNNLNGLFKQEDAHLLYIYEGARTGIAVGNLDNDQYLDMIVGNYSGGLSYYKGSIPLPQNDIKSIYQIDKINIQLFPNPTNNIIYFKIDNLLNFENVDVLIYNSLGTIIFKSSLNINNMCINVSDLPNGLYYTKTIIYDKQKNKVLIGNNKFSIIH